MEALLQSLQTQLQSYAAPLAIIGIFVFILSFLISPLLPDIMGHMRGYIQKALLAVAVIAFIPGIVTALAGLGG